jgi:hypothetical protein
MICHPWQTPARDSKTRLALVRRWAARIADRSSRRGGDAILCSMQGLVTETSDRAVAHSHMRGCRGFARAPERAEGIRE